MAQPPPPGNGEGEGPARGPRNGAPRPAAVRDHPKLAGGRGGVALTRSPSVCGGPVAPWGAAPSAAPSVPAEVVHLQPGFFHATGGPVHGGGGHAGFMVVQAYPYASFDGGVAYPAAPWGTGHAPVFQGPASPYGGPVAPWGVGQGPVFLDDAARGAAPWVPAELAHLQPGFLHAEGVPVHGAGGHAGFVAMDPLHGAGPAAVQLWDAGYGAGVVPFPGGAGGMAYPAEAFAGGVAYPAHHIVTNISPGAFNVEGGPAHVHVPALLHGVAGVVAPWVTGEVVHVQPGVLAGSAQNTLYDVYGAAAHGGLLGGFNPFVRGATEPGVFWDLSGLRFPGSAADDPDLLFGGAVGAFVGGVAYPTSSRDAGLGIGLGAQVFAGGVAYPAASWGAGLGLGDQAFAGGVAYPAAPWGAGLSLGAQAFAHPGDQPFVAGAGNPHAFWVAGRGGGQPSSSSTSGRLDGFGAPVKWHTAWRRELAVPPWRGGEPADMIPAYRGERNVLGAGGGGVQRGQAGLPPAPVRRCGIGRAGRGHGAPPVAPAAVPAPRPAHVPRALPAGAARPQTPAGQGRQARRREAQQRLAYQPPPQEADHDPATRVVRPPEGHGVFRTAQ
ncbi:elastin-like [Panicum virgatum]|uniref:elastin-like n=1 Tax=Panicum virgatum TaxID=38727 RepID=UPI0019D5FBF7|nr:elastin-like [Panicum virgatum]